MGVDSKKSVGAISQELKEKESFNSDVVSQQRAMLEDYEKNFFKAFERGKSQYQADFYVVVLTKQERLMDNVIRNYFIVRESCPTPNFDQIVYRCDHKKKSIDLLWTIPGKKTCNAYRHKLLEVPEEERALLDCILSFYDGSLLRTCKKLNKELKESSVSDSFNPEDFKHHENLVIQE